MRSTGDIVSAAIWNAQTLANSVAVTAEEASKAFQQMGQAMSGGGRMAEGDGSMYGRFKELLVEGTLDMGSSDTVKVALNTSNPEPVVDDCAYCGNLSHLRDRRGCCIACGGPREPGGMRTPMPAMEALTLSAGNAYSSLDVKSFDADGFTFETDHGEHVVAGLGFEPDAIWMLGEPGATELGQSTRLGF
jgi:hypothetical protein